MSDPYLSDDSDSSNDSDYRRKRRKKEETSEKGSYQIMRKFNGKAADDSVQIKNHQV